MPAFLHHAMSKKAQHTISWTTLSHGPIQMFHICGLTPVINHHSDFSVSFAIASDSKSAIARLYASEGKSALFLEGDRVVFQPASLTL